MNRNKIVKDLNKLLDIYNFSDYGPNGLQIEGSEEVKKIGFAVSATKNSIDQTVKEECDMLVTHHGLFWKFHGPKTITGPFAKRIKPLIKNDISLLGYHLPLDAHIKYGNAAGIASQLSLTDLRPFGDYKGDPTGLSGKFPSPIDATTLKEKLKHILNHEIILSSHNEQASISSIGIITGGANSDWVLAKRNNLDAYLTGEISEHDWHEAQESEIHYFAGGHNATERFGVLSLKKYIEEKYPDIQTIFIDSDNPA